jgi:LacI family transcriptional regulator
VRECRALGYRRIGLIVSQEVSERLENRWLAAYQLSTADLPRAQRVSPLMPPGTADLLAAIPDWYAKEKPDVVIMAELDPHGHYVLPPRVGMVSLSLEEQALGQVAGIFQDNRRMGAIAVEHLVARLERCEFGADSRGRLHLLAGRWISGSTAPGAGKERRILV